MIHEDLAQRLERLGTPPVAARAAAAIHHAIGNKMSLARKNHPEPQDWQTPPSEEPQPLRLWEAANARGPVTMTALPRGLLRAMDTLEAAETGNDVAWLIHPVLVWRLPRLPTLTNGGHAWALKTFDAFIDGHSAMPRPAIVRLGNLSRAPYRACTGPIASWLATLPPRDSRGTLRLLPEMGSSHGRLETAHLLGGKWENVQKPPQLDYARLAAFLPADGCHALIADRRGYLTLHLGGAF